MTVKYNKGELVWYWKWDDPEPLPALCLENKTMCNMLTAQGTIQILFGEKVLNVALNNISKTKIAARKNILAPWEKVHKTPTRGSKIQPLPDGVKPIYLDMEKLHDQIDDLIKRAMK